MGGVGVVCCVKTRQNIDQYGSPRKGDNHVERSTDVIYLL